MRLSVHLEHVDDLIADLEPACGPQSKPSRTRWWQSGPRDERQLDVTLLPLGTGRLEVALLGPFELESSARRSGVSR